MIKSRGWILCLEATKLTCMIYFLFEAFYFLNCWSLNLVNHFWNLSIIDISSYSTLLWHVIICYAIFWIWSYFFIMITNICINNIALFYKGRILLLNYCVTILIYFLNFWSLNLVNHFWNMSIIDISLYSTLLWHVIICYAIFWIRSYFFYYDH